MGSRLRENPERIFELFVEIGKPSGDKEEPFILQHYPPDYTDEGILKDVPKFAYPCSTECAAVDYFTFVLTDTKSKFTYGFCRHATGAQTCLCILSSVPWFEIFYRFLNLLAEISNRTEKNDVSLLLCEAYRLDLPEACSQVTIVAQEEMFTFTAPDPNKLPSIPASRNLTEYYNAMDTRNMVKIFASLLHERRVLFISKKLSRVTACVHAAASLIYPMNWQHLFIPILPNSYTDLLNAPMPFMIGVHSTIMEQANKLDLSGVVIVDTDNNTVTHDLQDDDTLPDEMTSILKKMLKNDRVKSSMQLEGDAISQAFLMSLVRTIGGYRDALKFQPNEKITFQKDAFLLSRPSSMRPFLEDLLELQIFHEFINERLDMLNCGIGFADVFEREATLHADKLNAHSRYKEWLTNMKKQGKKLQRGGKDIWDDFKMKARPAMNNAVQSVKSKIEDFYKEDLIPGSNKLTNLKIRSGAIKPSTILGSELKSLRPPRPPPRIKSSLTRGSPKIYTRATDSRSKHYRLINVEDKPADDFDLVRSQRMGFSLLDDPDIQSAIRKSVSLEEITHPREESDLSSVDSGSGTPSDGVHFSYVDLTTIDESAELFTAGNTKSLPAVSRQWSSPAPTTPTSNVFGYTNTNTTTTTATTTTTTTGSVGGGHGSGGHTALFSIGGDDDDSSPVVSTSTGQWQSFGSPEKKSPDIAQEFAQLRPASVIAPPRAATSSSSSSRKKEQQIRSVNIPPPSSTKTGSPLAPVVPPRPSARVVANTVAAFHDNFAPELPPRGRNRADSDFMKFEDNNSNVNNVTFDPLEDKSIVNSSSASSSTTSSSSAPVSSSSPSFSLAGPDPTIALKGPPEKTNLRRKPGGTSISRTPAFRRTKQNSFSGPSDPSDPASDASATLGVGVGGGVGGSVDMDKKSSDPTAMFDPLVAITTTTTTTAAAAPTGDRVGTNIPTTASTHSRPSKTDHPPSSPFSSVCNSSSVSNSSSVNNSSSSIKGRQEKKGEADDDDKEEEEEELLRDWDFHKKAPYGRVPTVGPTVMAPAHPRLSRAPTLPAATSPFFPAHPVRTSSSMTPPTPMPRSAHSKPPGAVTSPQLRGSKTTTTTHTTAHTTTPIKAALPRDYSHLSRQRTIEVDTSHRPGGDLFADLVDLHRGKSRTPSPQPRSWKAFQ
ncbi:DENN domain-containing protein 1C-like isoform X7 [Argonauta hians]